MSLFSLSVILTSCLFSYLMGSIPFGLILGKIFGVGDIRNIGSGNIGATNMLRTGRKGLAAATLLLDFAKGIIGVAVAQGFCDYFYMYRGGDFMIAPSIMYPAGLAAVVGHIYPVWLKFKGGKGVATTLGVFFATSPLIGILTCMGWAVIFYLTRISSLAAIGSIACAPVLGYLYVNQKFAVMAFLLAVIVIAKHKDNIRRLREGGETKWEKDNDPS